MRTKEKSGKFIYQSNCGQVSLTAYDYADFLGKMNALKKDVDNEFNPKISQELTKTEKIKLMGKIGKKVTLHQRILRSIYFNLKKKELAFTNGYLLLILNHNEGEQKNLFYHQYLQL